MKLVIQIPCYNEASTISETIRCLPKQVPGIDETQIVIIDDGSKDSTAQLANELGVDLVSLPCHQGLARAFMAGLKYALSRHADIIINTDGDNQYKGEYIKDLIKPILEKRADIVIGCRPIDTIKHFSKIKKLLQRWGGRVVRFLTGVEISDVTSGFRAYSRRAARKIKIYSDFSYTLETIIQAARNNLMIATIPIDVNPPTRPSRLFSGNWYYIRKQIFTILRIWSLYSPVKLFARSGFVSISLGLVLFLRFIYYYFVSWPNPSGKVQSLIVASILLMFGFFLILIGVLADLIAVNRKLLEDIIDKQEEDEQKE